MTTTTRPTPTEDQARTRFNPNDHILQLPQGRGKTADYLEVKWRLVWLRQDHPEATILTELLVHDQDVKISAEVTRWENGRPIKETKVAPGRATVRATVTLGTGAFATGMKSETAVSFPDYLEKAETGAIGRALAMLGFGTQFTGDEFDEGERIVDAPVVRKSSPEATTRRESAPSPEAPKSQGPNQSQLTALRSVGIKDEQGQLLDFNNEAGQSQGIRVINALLAEKRKSPVQYKANPQPYIAKVFAEEGLHLDPDE